MKRLVTLAIAAALSLSAPAQIATDVPAAKSHGNGLRLLLNGHSTTLAGLVGALHNVYRDASLKFDLWSCSVS